MCVYPVAVCCFRVGIGRVCLAFGKLRLHQIAFSHVKKGSLQSLGRSAALRQQGARLQHDFVRAVRHIGVCTASIQNTEGEAVL